MNDCLFCKIIAGEIPSQKVYEDDRVLVFRDIAPAAPTHILAVPKAHIPSPAAITEEDGPLVGHIFAVLAKVAAEQGLSKGFRIVANCGEEGGQSVGHLHFHLLAGRQLAWPPG